MKKIMILGASKLQIPAIIEAKKMGLYVIAVDMDKNAPGFQYSDVNEIVSTNDIQNVVKLAEHHKINGVMTLATDMPMRTVAAVAEKLKLPGISVDTALKSTNKAIMRKVFKENGVPIPLFVNCKTKEDFLEAIKLFENKFIVKPADSSGSRGISLVDKSKKNLDLSKIYDYTKQFSMSDEILVEEFMEGKEVSVETLSINGEVNIIAITDKLTTGAPHFVELRHSQPSVLTYELRKKISDITKEGINALGIENGPSHTEIIITKDGPKIVEIGARLGGDSITSHLVPLSTGINIVKKSIEIALGISTVIKHKWNKGSAIAFFKADPGVLSAIEGIENSKKIPGVCHLEFHKSIGDKIVNYRSSTDRIGYVISQSNTAREAIEICKEAMELIDFKYEV